MSSCVKVGAAPPGAGKPPCDDARLVKAIKGASMAGTNRAGAQLMGRLLSGWDTGEAALHASLADGIRRVITSGALQQGTTLPSQRMLAQALAVSRTTVAAAYNNLRDEGWLGAQHGGTTWVRQPNPARHASWQGDRLTSYSTQGGPLDLTSGTLPASRVLHRILSEPWTRAMTDLLASDGFLTSGWADLRERVADYFKDLDLPTEPDNLIITNGAHHSLTLVADGLLGAGDTVLVEDPTYRGAFDVFGRLGARTVGVRTDNEGIDPQHLEDMIRRHHPRLLYALPAAHNATGITWMDARRKAVAGLVERAGLVVVEDTSTIDLQLGPTIGPLGRLLPDELSITLGSVTKLFWAGLRVGWVRGTSARVGAVRRTRVAQDLAGSLPSQVIAARCLDHVAEARVLRRGELAHAQAEAVNLLAKHLPTWSCQLADGSSLWVDTGMDTTRLSAQLRRHGILLNAGPTFSPSEGFATYLRIPLGHRLALFEAVPMIAEIIGTERASG